MLAASTARCMRFREQRDHRLRQHPYHIWTSFRRKSPCRKRIVPSRTHRSITSQKKKLVSPSAKPGIESSRMINGATPNRNVRPGTTFQQDGRAHQISTLRMLAIPAIASSMVLNERLSVGARKNSAITKQMATMGATLKNQASQRRSGIRSMERQI